MGHCQLCRGLTSVASLGVVNLPQLAHLGRCFGKVVEELYQGKKSYQSVNISLTSLETFSVSVYSELVRYPC